MKISNVIGNIMFDLGWRAHEISSINTGEVSFTTHPFSYYRRGYRDLHMQFIVGGGMVVHWQFLFRLKDFRYSPNFYGKRGGVLTFYDNPNPDQLLDSNYSQCDLSDPESLQKIVDSVDDFVLSNLGLFSKLGYKIDRYYRRRRCGF